MPITLPPLSRRGFLKGSLAVAAGWVAPPSLLPGADAGAADPDRLLLLSDIHIAADPATKRGDDCMHDHLKQAVDEVLASGLRPSAGFVNGDVAYLLGQADDYVTAGAALKPLREAGTPLHLGLGNHDNFERFRAAFPPEAGAADPVASKQVLVVETTRANIVVLDSLGETNKTPGVLGAAQLAWLSQALDQRREKPAILLVHHDPATLPTTSGLTDTDKLYETILPRKQVKAVVFGHTHRRSVGQIEGVHLVNLPSVAYVFKTGEPTGWTDLLLTEKGGTFTLHAIDKGHPQDGDKYELTWRGDA